MFDHYKGRSLRFCVDSRKLNAVTIPDSYTLSPMDKYLESLGEAAVFAPQEANLWYYQAQIEESACYITEFLSHHCLYRFTKMLLILNNILTAFRRAIYVIPASVRCQFALVCLHGIFIF